MKLLAWIRAFFSRGKSYVSTTATLTLRMQSRVSDAVIGMAAPGAPCAQAMSLTVRSAVRSPIRKPHGQKAFGHGAAVVCPSRLSGSVEAVQRPRQCCRRLTTRGFSALSKLKVNCKRPVSLSPGSGSAQFPLRLGAGSGIFRPDQAARLTFANETARSLPARR